MTKLQMDHFGSMLCTDSRADMPSAPPSQLTYAQKCAPSLISRHPQHLTSVRKVLIRRGRIEPLQRAITTFPQTPPFNGRAIASPQCRSEQ